MKPYAAGTLPVAGGQRIAWETSGSPAGAPALYLHGGPGGGLGRGGYREQFDPDRCRVVGFDQRGCGRSRPLATDDLAGLGATQTVAAQLADVEALREHLGVERWLVTGVSWGTSLALAYVLAHPDRVTGVVLTAVAATTQPLVTWITETVGRVFPEAWEAFERASGRRPGQRVVEAYAARLRDPDPAVRQAAAAAWCAWEGAHVALAPGADGRPLFAGDPDRQRLFATLVTHYWAHQCLDADALLAGLGALGDVPAALVHGRLDVSGPVGFAWDVHRAWPGSTLVVVEDEGHGGEQMSARTAEAVARLLPGA